MAQEASKATVLFPAESCQADPPYFDRLLGIIGGGDLRANTSFAAINNFDKKFLTSIHDKAAMDLTKPRVAKILQLENRRGKRYEVCHKGTQFSTDLVPVNLKDLKIGRRNECVVLYGKLCVDAFQFGRVFTVLEDVETKMAVVLSIVPEDPQSCDQYFARINYPRNRNVAVMEPMLIKAESGLIYIQVENPLSIEWIRPRKVADSGDANVTVGIEKFEGWMDCANYAYNAKEWEKSIRNFTKCEISYLKGLRVDDLSLLDLYYNRFHAQMQLGRHAQALQDAEKCRKLDSSNSYGFKNKIQEFLPIGRSKDPYHFHFQDKDDQDFTSTYSKSLDMGETITGEAGPGAPDGDFFGSVEIRTTRNGCGRGFFATLNIQVGEVVLISNAFAVSDNAMADPVKNGLLQKVKEALSSCGDNRAKLFLSLASRIPQLAHFLPQMSDFIKESAEENKLSARMGEHTVPGIFDSLVLHIIERTALDNSSPGVVRTNGVNALFSASIPSRRYYGVWLAPSFLNHSCAPNAARIGAGDILRVYATKEIEMGQEITIPYFGVLVPHNIRHPLCQSFGFGCECKCKRCEVERKFIDSDSLVQQLYSDYFAAYTSENQRSSLLMQLLRRVEHHLRIFKDKDSEAWIRSSFLPVYMAQVTCRNANPCRPEILFKEACSILETCPGDVQFLIFCEFCILFGRDAAVSSSTSFLRPGLAQEACFSVYRRQREDILQAVFNELLEEYSEIK